MQFQIIIWNRRHTAIRQRTDFILVVSLLPKSNWNDVDGFTQHFKFTPSLINWKYDSIGQTNKIASEMQLA